TPIVAPARSVFMDPQKVVRDSADLKFGPVAQTEMEAVDEELELVASEARNGKSGPIQVRKSQLRCDRAWSGYPWILGQQRPLLAQEQNRKQQYPQRDAQEPCLEFLKNHQVHTGSTMRRRWPPFLRAGFRNPAKPA